MRFEFTNIWEWRNSCREDYGRYPTDEEVEQYRQYLKDIAQDEYEQMEYMEVTR